MSENTDPQERRRSRREFLSTALATPILAAEISSSFRPNGVSVISPDGRIRFDILLRGQSRLSYRVTFRNRAVIEDSPLGIVIDGVDLCRGMEASRVARYRMNERYASRGVHSEAINHCNGVKLSLRHAESGAGFTLDARVFNAGVA